MEFFGQDNEINLHQKHPEFCDWRWVKINDLDKLIVSFKKNLYRDIISEFKNFI